MGDLQSVYHSAEMTAALGEPVVEFATGLVQCQKRDLTRLPRTPNHWNLAKQYVEWMKQMAVAQDYSSDWFHVEDRLPS